MKHILSIIVLTITLALGANIRMLVVTPTPEMHCNNCETKIKKYMMYEKGLQKIETSLEKQTVTFTYDARKTSKENIVSAMKKCGYDCKVVKDVPVEKSKKAKK